MIHETKLSDSERRIIQNILPDTVTGFDQIIEKGREGILGR